MNELGKNLNELLGKRFDADFAELTEQPSKEREYRQALERASQSTGYPPENIEEAILKKRYPEYCSARLKNELPDVPPTIRRT
ncbi:MAG: hypothetical protein JWM99_2893 [Verrucomicrobiales bacterium]|nr:hypothetical protein [Verrucomicrobiales bacterium]